MLSIFTFTNVCLADSVSFDSTPQEVEITSENGESVTFSFNEDVVIAKKEKSFYIKGTTLMIAEVSELTEKNTKTDNSHFNNDLTTVSSNQVIKFYKIDMSDAELDEFEESLVLPKAVLTRTNEATNPMGNIIAKLSVRYSSRGSGTNTIYYLKDATSSYRQVIYEGVTPQTSQLYWYGL